MLKSRQSDIWVSLSTMGYNSKTPIWKSSFNFHAEKCITAVGNLKKNFNGRKNVLNDNETQGQSEPFIYKLADHLQIKPPKEIGEHFCIWIWIKFWFQPISNENEMEITFWFPLSHYCPFH